MNFFLHWLRHDLRRLRTSLIIWTAVVGIASIFAGWLNLHVLTFDFTSPGFGDWLPGLLTGHAAYVACRIFWSDSAGAPQAFWKTRPPSGYAIGASKLVLAGVFLLILPMAAWTILKITCLPRGYIAYSDGDFTTAEYLWATLSLLVCIVALGTASARDEMKALAKGAMVAAAVVAAALIGYIPALPLPWIDPATPVLRPWVIIPAASLALLLSTVVFMAARRSRTPHPGVTLASFLLPFLLVRASIALLHEPPTVPEDDSFAQLPASTAETIRITQPQNENRRLSRTGGGWSTGKGSEPIAIYEISLPVGGLPPHSVVFGRWLNLTLTAPDGRSISIDPDTSLRRSNVRQLNLGRPQEVSGCEMVFKEEELAPILGQPCAAKGTLRLVLMSRHEEQLNPWQPETVETGIGRYRFEPAQPPFRKSSQDWFEPAELPTVFGIEREPAPEYRWSLVHPALGHRIGMEAASTRLDHFSFLQSWRITIHLETFLRMMKPDDSDPLIESLRSTEKTDWRFTQTWYAPSSRMDVPLVLKNILVPAPGQ